MNQKRITAARSHNVTISPNRKLDHLYQTKKKKKEGLIKILNLQSQHQFRILLQISITYALRIKCN
jgi:hypothetical protein